MRGKQFKNTLYLSLIIASGLSFVGHYFQIVKYLPEVVGFVSLGLLIVLGPITPALFGLLLVENIHKGWIKVVAIGLFVLSSFIIYQSIKAFFIFNPGPV
jgi:hypothetical protein